MTKIFKTSAIISSDRAYTGVYQDRGGPVISAWVSCQPYLKWLNLHIIPDSPDELKKLVISSTEVDLIITSGATGLGSRDSLPQTLTEICSYEIKGIGEYLRAESFKITPNAILSRGGGWVLGKTLILAIPGNPKAIAEHLNLCRSFLKNCLDSLNDNCDHTHSGQSHANL